MRPLDCFASLAMTNLDFRADIECFGPLGLYISLTCFPRIPNRKLAEGPGMVSAGTPTPRRSQRIARQLGLTPCPRFAPSQRPAGAGGRAMTSAMLTGVAVVLAAAAICYLYFKDVV